MIHSRYRMIVEEQKTWYCRLGNFTYTVLLRGVSSPLLQRTEEDEGGSYFDKPYRKLLRLRDLMFLYIAERVRHLLS
jgi:hypothetical protein